MQGIRYAGLSVQLALVLLPGCPFKTADIIRHLPEVVYIFSKPSTDWCVSVQLPA